MYYFNNITKELIYVSEEGEVKILRPQGDFPEFPEDSSIKDKIKFSKKYLKSPKIKSDYHVVHSNGKYEGDIPMKLIQEYGRTIVLNIRDGNKVGKPLYELAAENNVSEAVVEDIIEKI